MEGRNPKFSSSDLHTEPSEQGCWHSPLWPAATIVSKTFSLTGKGATEAGGGRVWEGSRVHSSFIQPGRLRSGLEKEFFRLVLRSKAGHPLPGYNGSQCFRRICLRLLRESLQGHCDHLNSQWKQRGICENQENPSDGAGSRELQSWARMHQGHRREISRWLWDPHSLGKRFTAEVKETTHTKNMYG